MSEQLGKQVAGLRLIVAAMMVGIVVFGVVVLIVGPRMPHNSALTSVFLAVMAVVGLVELPFYLVLRSTLLTKLQRRSSEGLLDEDAEAKVFPVWQTLTLIRSAMLEGISLFALVITLVTGVKMIFIVPVAALMLLAAYFPTREKLTELTASITGQNPYSG